VPGSAGASSAPGATAGSGAGSGAGFTDLATALVLPLAAAPDHPKVPRHLGVVAGLSAGGAADGGSRGVTAGWGVDDSPVGLAGAAGTEACRVAAAYRADGDSSLAGFGADKLVVVWVAARRRLTVARTGRFAADLLIWSEGGYLAFGTEPAHLLALFRAPLGPGALGPARSEAGHRLARARRLAAGDRVSVTAARRPRRAHRSGLRVVGWPLRAASAPASAPPSAPEPVPAPAAALAPAPTPTVMSAPAPSPALVPSPALAPGPALALAPVPTAAPESRDHGDG
jgi:hypothetical protein